MSQHLLTVFIVCRDNAAKNDGVFVDEVSSPQNENREGKAKVGEGGEVQPLIDELAATAARQAELVAQLREKYAGESSTLAQKDEELARLRAQLADAQVELEASRVYAEKITHEKLSAMAEVEKARGELHHYKSDLTWVVRFLEEKKVEHFASIAKFREDMLKIIQTQEDKLRGLSIEYDEELYPHLMSTIAERRYSSCTFLLPNHFVAMLLTYTNCFC